MKEITLDLWLRVENNNKFVRGKSRVRAEIEDYILSRFDVIKLRKDGYDYEIIVEYAYSSETDQ